MFSPSLVSASRPPTGLRRGGPVHIHEVLPAALDRLAREADRRDSPAPAPRPPPRWPTFPRAA